jgi:hypothetical protein
LLFVNQIVSAFFVLTQPLLWFDVDFLFYQGIPSTCLELSLLSSYNSKQLQRVSTSELATLIPADNCCRYAVCDSPLPADRCSYWAAVLKANAYSIDVGVIADKGVKYRFGCCNVDQPTFCGVGAYHDDRQNLWLWKNGDRSGYIAMASATGDVLLFRLDPLQRRLAIINSRTRQATDITEVARGAPNKPLFITININAHPHYGPQLTQVELRQVTAAERAMLE